MLNDLEVFFHDLQKRGVIANVANLENNFYHLKPNEKIIYWGIDCTATSLHIGHLFLLIQTIRFAKAGFTILLVLGGATSKIGDPSDKLQERPQLTNETIKKYKLTLKTQLEEILIRPTQTKKIDFAPLELFYVDNPQLLSSVYQILKINETDETPKKWEKYLKYIWPIEENKYQILNNNDWLSKVSFIDFIDRVGRNISINYLLAKETIKQRVNSETGLSFLAFSYSLLQAYDFYYLYQNYNCCGQLGGSDQWGNLTTGLKLIHSYYPTNKTFAYTFNMLTDQTGKKFSKSENNNHTLRLDSAKKDFYDFWRNLPDEQAKIYIQQFTFLSNEQINQLLKLNNPAKLRIPQRILTELLFYLLYQTEGLNWLSEKLKVL